MKPTVYLVEDDQNARESTAWLLTRHGFATQVFATPLELLRDFDAARYNQSGNAACLLLDLALPSMSGLGLHHQLQAAGCKLPFIIISGHAEVEDAVRAMRNGAIDFLEKPCRLNDLLGSIAEALEVDRGRRFHEGERAEIQRRLEELTPREGQVLELVASGELTKRIARTLGISAKTVEVHRSNLAKKMNAESLISLVRKLTASGFLIEHPDGPRFKVRAWESKAGSLGPDSVVA